MFGGQVFHGCICRPNRRFLHPEISRWRTYTGSSYNFVTEKHIKVILAVLAAWAMFCVCIATEIASTSVSVTSLLVFPVFRHCFYFRFAYAVKRSQH